MFARAVKIITARATQGAGLELMLQDIAGKDIERRDKALTSFSYLCANRKLNDAVFIVTC